MKANSGAEMPRLHTHAAAPLLIDIADIRHENPGRQGRRRQRAPSHAPSVSP